MSPKEAPGKKQIAVILSAGLVERAKNVVHGTAGVTLAGLVAEGLQKAVERRERANGGPFKARRKPLGAGRPPASQSKEKRAAVSTSDSRGSRRPTPKDRTSNTRK